MRHKTRFAAAVTALALAAGCGGPKGPETTADSAPGNAAVDSLFAEWNVPGSPGCALAVTQDGNLVYSRGYGYANLDYDIPITPQTVFDVASVTKQFNAASLSMLALEGKLSLEDDVRKWLPELPAYDWPVTLQHMIHHTSGLRDYLNLFPLAGRGDYYPISHPQILAMMSRQRELIFPPGDRYRYSNTAYMLLAQVVERASGESFGAFTRARIFEPLGMAGSLMYDNLEQIIPHRAIGYDIGEDGNSRIVHNYNFDVAGDGQLYSTMEDLLRWDNYLHGAGKPAIHAVMLVEGVLNDGEPTGYAQGLRLGEYRGLSTVGHSGSSWGFRTELVRFVEPGLSIAISCNFDSARPGTLAQRVADYYLADSLGPATEDNERGDDSEDETSKPPQLTPEQLSAYVGDFFSPELDATYRFAVADGRLVVRIEQEPPVTVAPLADDHFEIDFYEQGLAGPQTASLEFDRNRAGRVTGFGLSSGTERGIVFERLR